MTMQKYQPQLYLRFFSVGVLSLSNSIPIQPCCATGVFLCTAILLGEKVLIQVRRAISGIRRALSDPTFSKSRHIITSVAMFVPCLAYLAFVPLIFKFRPTAWLSNGPARAYSPLYTNTPPTSPAGQIRCMTTPPAQQSLSWPKICSRLLSEVSGE